MRHTNKILGIGIVLVLIPLLGFPATWRDIFSVILGLWLCGMAVSIRRAHQLGEKNSASSEKSHRSTDSFVAEDVPLV